jgi:hypothetical protein
MIYTQTGTERLTMAGAAQLATIAANTNKVRLAAEGGDLRYDLLNTATNVSVGYLLAGSIVWLNVSSNLSIYGETGAFANLLYVSAI